MVLRGTEQGARRGAAALGRRRAVPRLCCGLQATTTRAIGRGGTGEAHRAWNRTGRDADEPAASSGGGARTELEEGPLLGVSGS